MAVVPIKRYDVDMARCLTSDGVGSLVYIRGEKVDGKYLVETVDPTDYSKMPAVAMIIQKDNDTDCWIQFKGQVFDVYGSLTPGEKLFVDDSGMLSDEPPEPTALEPYKFLQAVGVSLASNVVGFEPDLTLTKRRL